MQFSRATVIIKTISDIGILLDFADCDAGTNGVYCACRYEDNVPRFYWYPIQQALDLARDGGISQTIRRNLAFKAERDCCIWLGIDHKPSLRFAETVVVMLGVVVGGVDLHRQTAGGEKEFHQQWTEAPIRTIPQHFLILADYPQSGSKRSASSGFVLRGSEPSLANCPLGGCGEPMF